MGEEYQNALDGFTAVWQRVSGTETAEAATNCQAGENGADAAALLRDALRRETTAEVHYRLIALLTGGRSAELLRSLSAECRGAQQALQTELFLRSGDTCPAAPEPMPTDNYPGCLRRAYLRETETEQAYLRGAALLPELSELFGALALRSGQRRSVLTELVRLMME